MMNRLTALNSSDSSSASSALRARSRGFTLLEFVIVLAVIAILMIVARPTWETAKKRSREAALATTLHQMRQVINRYVADKGKLPESLDALVLAGYYAELPVDPMTHNRTWNFELGKLPGSTALGESGIIEVHSLSEELSLDGETHYNTW
jgi:general secretion pathway protein G